VVWRRTEERIKARNKGTKRKDEKVLLEKKDKKKKKRPRKRMRGKEGE
jgi:hypothetical protein